MNMNLDIVNRALYDAGQDTLAAAGVSGGNTSYELCKAYYIATFLEALSEVEWVGGRRRAKLVRTGRPVAGDSRYRFAYDIPCDCAKPIELQDNDFFVIEDRLLLADTPDAELLYVSNGKGLRPIAAASCGKPADIHEAEYLGAGPPGTVPDYTLYPGSVSDIGEALPEDPPPADDFPDYVSLVYEPKFHEYVEKKLAAKFSMKLSAQPELHVQLLQEAMIVKQEAIEASRAGRAAKVKPNPWWADELGLGGRKNSHA